MAEITTLVALQLPSVHGVVAVQKRSAKKGIARTRESDEPLALAAAIRTEHKIAIRNLPDAVAAAFCCGEMLLNVKNDSTTANSCVA